ncbi:aminopeptidase [Fictibacillus sp. Mic-4]|uniref:aminopeptidase n=1 Tax=Fictibacillus sp. Mic-4 TaxID=3132826 RepID=UPI003CECC6F1
MDNFQTYLDQYAELAIKVGLNVQEGQHVLIQAPIHSADFVRKVVEKAYLAGAKTVYVDYNDEELTLLKYRLAPQEGLKEFPMWRANGYVEMAKNNTALLQIYAPNPTLLKDIDPEKVAIVNKTAATAMKEFNDYTITGKISWSIISVPSPEWAAQIFPGESKEESVKKLWEAIFTVTRVMEEDPVHKWQSHIENLTRKVDYLNEKKYKKLHYQSEGTNLTIELPNEHQWLCAQFTNKAGTSYVPNMPTEEVFTVPVKYGVNGVVTSKKPLNYNGVLIDNFSLTFQDGKVVDFQAETGYETLKNLLTIDENICYLGEVALVPHNSPISNSNLIFYNTLFDENASCHIALGAGLPMCIKDGSDMTKEELEKIGLNDSINHVDFMIGSQDLAIDGEKEDGSIEPVFRNGNWAF